MSTAIKKPRQFVSCKKCGTVMKGIYTLVLRRHCYDCAKHTEQYSMRDAHD